MRKEETNEIKRKTGERQREKREDRIDGRGIEGREGGKGDIRGGVDEKGIRGRRRETRRGR